MTHISEYTDKSTLLIIFEAIQARIADKVPEISEVVVFSNQEGNEDVQRPFTYPYISVQMIINWYSNETVGTNTENPAVSGAVGRQSKGSATIIIHTMFYNRNDDTKAFIQNEDIRHRVHRAVHLHYIDPFFTRLIKVQDQLPIEINANQDYMTTYSTEVKEGAYLDVEIGSIDEFGVDDGFENIGDRPELPIP